jgi:hypothetical protein
VSIIFVQEITLFYTENKAEVYTVEKMVRLVGETKAGAKMAFRITLVSRIFHRNFVSNNSIYLCNKSLVETTLDVSPKQPLKRPVF